MKLRRYCEVFSVLAILIFVGCGGNAGQQQRETENTPSGPPVLKPSRDIAIFPEGLYVIDVSGDGRRLIATGRDEKADNETPEIVRVYDLATNKTVRDFEVHASRNLHAAISSDGGLLAIGDARGGNRICEIDSGESIHEQLFPFAWVKQLAFVNGDRTLIGIVDDKFVAYDVESGMELYRLFKNDDVITCYALLDECRKIVTGSENGALRIWDVDSRSVETILQTGQSTPKKVWTLAAAPSGKLLVSLTDSQPAKVWDLNTESTIRELKHVSDVLPEFVFLGDETFLAATTIGWLRPDGERDYEREGSPVLIINVSTGEIEAFLEVSGKGLLDGVAMMKLSHDGKTLFVAMWTGMVHVFDVSKWNE